jgi:hypothetical protein
MLFNKTYQSLMKSIIEEREWDEPNEPYGYTDRAVYKYDNDELEFGDDLYSVNAEVVYSKHPEGVDVDEVEITELFMYDPSVDDNVEVNLHDIEPQLRQDIEDRIEEDFLDQISSGRIDFRSL